MIAKEGFSAFGIDGSKEGTRLCLKMLKHWNVSANIVIGDMRFLPYEENYFDAVVDIVSLQHLTFSQHIRVYSEVARVLKPQGHFFSYHLGNRSYSYKYGGGALIDKFTIDNIKNPNAPLANNGITCFLTEKAAEKMLKEVGFKNINIENVIKTYNNRSIKIQYLAIKAKKF